MRIGIACYPTYGCSGVVASELALELTQRGHEVHVLSYALPFRLHGFHENLYFHEIQISTYPLFRYPPITLNAACKMAEVAECARLDVLHVHYAVPWAVCAHLAREVIADKGRGLKIVTTLHGTDITLVGAEPSFFKMTQFGITHSDAVTAVSKYLANQTCQTFGITTPPQVIYNSVDTERFRPRQAKCCRKHFAPKDERLLIHVPNFRPVKNVVDVVRTFALVRKRLPTRLLMVGEGLDLSKAREATRELGLEADVLFLGNQESVEEILPCADCFLLPSSYESFGLAALEAMSCGLPVLATEVGGLSEVIDPGVDGWLCHVGDVECMAARAVEVLSHKEKSRAMGDAARRKAMARFTPDQIVPQYEALYRRIVEG
jgi:N-acetyl-alpha-D-glucosaminyl L-malate synthase BshA